MTRGETFPTRRPFEDFGEEYELPSSGALSTSAPGKPRRGGCARCASSGAGDHHALTARKRKALAQVGVARDQNLTWIKVIPRFGM